MRVTGLSLAFLATVNVLVVSTPAFADDSGPTTTVTTTTPAADGTVMLHVESPRPVDIERRQGEVGAWQHVCTSPCDVSIPLFDQYRVAPVGSITESRPFLIDAANKDRVTLVVNPGVKSKSTIGTFLLIGGAATIVTGVVIIIAGTSGSNQFGNDGTTNNGFTNLAFAGSALILAGLGAAIVGGAWRINNQHSAVSGDLARPPTATNEKTAKREPIFIKPQAEQVARTPAYVFPVFTKSF